MTNHDDPNESFSFDTPETTPAHVTELYELNHLTADVEAYNSRFSLGASLSRIVMSVLAAQKDGQQEGIRDQLLDDQEDMTIRAYRLSTTHAPILGAMGLAVHPLTGRTSTIYYQSGQFGTGELFVAVQDPKALTTFLGRQSADQVAATGAHIPLERLADTMGLQVRRNPDLFWLQTNTRESVEQLGDILQEYNRLGVQGAGVARLATYYERALRGDLREYLAVERIGLLNEPGRYFGPGDWQSDSTPENLEQRWTEALEVVRAMTINPQAEELRQAVRTHLRGCVAHAISYMQSPDLDTSPEIREWKLRILDRAQQELQ